MLEKRYERKEKGGGEKEMKWFKGMKGEKKKGFVHKQKLKSNTIERK